jgi:uncharacterized membrane protein YkoI
MATRCLSAFLLLTLPALFPATSSAQAGPTITAKAARPEYLQEAKITADSATGVALTRVPGGQVREAELEREKGRLVYSFDISVAGKPGLEEVLVDARSGKVIAVSHESPADEAREAEPEPPHR